jgi:hypothetical protein
MEMMTMTRTIVFAPIVLIVALSLSVALVDHMKERASQDRLLLGDEVTTELLAR